MTNHPNRTTDGRTEGQKTDRVASGSSRRDFLKATAAAGALAAGVGSGVVGTSTAGIPTPRLSVDGNLIKDPQGEAVKLRGLNIADPKRLSVTAPARGKTPEQLIRWLTNADEGWYPRVLRVPVQPVDIGEHPPGPVAEDNGDDPAPPVPAFDQDQLESYLETYLDPVVDLCAERGVYCIVDYHRHWDGVQWAESQKGPINEPLQEEVLGFWQTVAPRYADSSHVFFEIYNEPTEPGFYSSRYKNGDPAPWMQDKWDLWRELAQPWVDAIREHSENLIIVGSPGWSQTPEGATIYGEFDGGNLSYAYHTYPGHAANNENTWAEQGGHDYSGVEGAFEEVPLFVTEFGWQDEFSGYDPHRWISGTTDGFGQPFVDWLESEPSLHWTAWCADPVWLPAMFERGFETGGETDAVGNPYEEEIPTHCEDLPCEWELRGNPDMGALVKETLAETRDDGIPSGEGPETPTEDTPTDGTPTDDTPTEDTPADDGPNWPDGTTDPDGDGAYEDLNGNGEVDYSDVVEYFENMDSEGMQNNVEYYDYNGNGEIDYDDLVALFGEVQ
ncbi:cellulase family glycosylhydrolase [Halomicrobium salinisoli]|uniref:cellulase family glycosylhydrolase n=1 Tax=Halomicrobium salinisoli TaxID=2878391 RepID=UPI001CF04459|nr:cellulase family glycosylhydrolase [Halomicrobium salinisoli]